MLPLTFHPRTHRNRNLRLFHRLPTAGDGQDPPGGHLSTAVPVPPLARPVGKKEQAAPAFLIPACVDPGGRDSLGRGLDAGSIAAVAADPAVQREPDALPQHLSGAYRDPHAAKARLDEMVKRQGWTRTQRGSPRTVPSSAICEAKLDFLPVPVQRPNAPAPSGRPTWSHPVWSVSVRQKPGPHKPSEDRRTSSATRPDAGPGVLAGATIIRRARRHRRWRRLLRHLPIVWRFLA